MILTEINVSQHDNVQEYFFWHFSEFIEIYMLFFHCRVHFLFCILPLNQREYEYLTIFRDFSRFFSTGNNKDVWRGKMTK